MQDLLKLKDTEIREKLLGCHTVLNLKKFKLLIFGLQNGICTIHRDCSFVSLLSTEPFQITGHWQMEPKCTKYPFVIIL